MQVEAGKVLKVKLWADDFQAGDELEVFCIVGGDVEAEMKGGGADDQVLEWDDDAFGGLFSFDLASELGDFEGHGLHSNCFAQIFHEGSTAITVGNYLCAVDTMREFR